MKRAKTCHGYMPLDSYMQLEIDQEEDNFLRTPLQGQLNKYTNVMKGWQHRWFVLDPESGVLEYYVNHEENKKHRARGSVHLGGAVISPSDEDSQTFSVNAANGEIYRLRASDAKERQHWVNKLRAVTQYHTERMAQTTSRLQPTRPASSYNDVGPLVTAPVDTRRHSSGSLGSKPSPAGTPVQRRRSKHKSSHSLQRDDPFKNVKEALNNMDELQRGLAENIEGNELRRNNGGHYIQGLEETLVFTVYRAMSLEGTLVVTVYRAMSLEGTLVVTVYRFDWASTFRTSYQCAGSYNLLGSVPLDVFGSVPDAVLGVVLGIVTADVLGRVPIDILCSVPADVLSGLPSNDLGGVLVDVLGGVQSDVLCSVPAGVLGSVQSDVLCSVPADVLGGVQIDVLSSVPVDVLGGVQSDVLCSVPADVSGGLPSNDLGGVLADVLGGVQSDVLCSVPADVLSRLPSNDLGGVLADVLGGVKSDVLCSVPADVLGDVQSDVLCSVLADVLGGVPSNDLGGVLADVLGGVQSDVLCSVPADVLSRLPSNDLGGVLADVLGDVQNDMLCSVLADVFNRRCPKQCAMQCPSRCLSNDLGGVLADVLGHVQSDVLCSVLADVLGGLPSNDLGGVLADVLGDVQSEVLCSVPADVLGRLPSNDLGGVLAVVLGRVLSDVLCSVPADGLAKMAAALASARVNPFVGLTRKHGVKCVSLDGVKIETYVESFSGLVGPENVVAASCANGSVVFFNSHDCAESVCDCLLLKATSQAATSTLEQCLSILQQQHLVQTQSAGIPASASMQWMAEPAYSSRPRQQARKSKPESTYSGDFNSDDIMPNQTEVEIDHDREVMDSDKDDDQELGGVEEHKSIILHLLSQLKLGMDLTKVVLPTFILERRSLLEMFADFMSHPDMFLRIPSCPTAETRMLAVLEYYLCSFHVGRKGSIAKKPYNPIIGETFHCSWDVVQGYNCLPESNNKHTSHSVNGTINGSAKNNQSENSLPVDRVTYVAEQVSHHPPVSAFYAECASKNICMNTWVWTKSKFLGMSVGVVNVGEGIIYDLEHDEEYSYTLPSAYGRNILTVPWMELGGKVNIACAKTGYTASVTFHTKPFYGGKVHRISGEVKHTQTNRVICKFSGEWNGIIEFIYTNLEEKQRQEGKHRVETKTPWKTKLFHKKDEGWQYKHVLKKTPQPSS
uniref:Oxysterol-binding protein n=1 Tax=Saccoglossus kowalevskii TaxID=10224 RepID=A0ABM0LVU7_SACKO|nr:PREDICTED: oxysterol-binding protein-related protein 11-like [Saccoglossus kowalevskii]